MFLETEKLLLKANNCIQLDKGVNMYPVYIYLLSNQRKPGGGVGIKINQGLKVWNDAKKHYLRGDQINESLCSRKMETR